MAKTIQSSANNLTKKVWEEKLYRDSVKESFFMERFSGTSSDNIVHVKSNLEAGKGDKITFGLRMKLSGAGVEEGQILEGNEEALSTYDFSLTLKQYRHAVRDDGEMDRKRAVWDMDEESRSALKDWMTEKIDQLCFDAAFLNPTLTAYRSNASTGAFATNATYATALADISAANSKCNAAFLSALKTIAKNGQGRNFIPLRPIKYKGKMYYVLLVHDDVVYDLKQDPILQAAWENAMERGEDNPLFRDAVVVWDGVIVHSHENVPKGTNGGGGAVAYSKGVLLGAQGLAWAWGRRPKVVEKDFDYEDEHAYAIGMLGRAGKPVFNSKDYGSIHCVFARTNISG